MTFRIVLILTLLFSSVPALAEYRVFLLKIYKIETSSRNPAGDEASAAEASSAEVETTSDFRLVESTLDPLQYRQYYPLAANEAVVYIDTWRCYGRTDQFKNFCPNPKGQNEAEDDSSP